ncbi:MAG: hypothetical protein VCF25_12980, partial [Candidatus Poribacteria bacterium]
LSFGINHLHPDLWKQDYNHQAWEKRLGLDDLNSRKFAPALKAWFLQTCRQYGFNTVGVHTELSIVNNPQSSMPYMQPIHFVDIPHWKPEIPTAISRMSFQTSSQRTAMGWQRNSLLLQGMIRSYWAMP